MVYLSNIDIASFIVAVLGLITTVLLGWNIYTLIDFKNKISGIDRREKEIANKLAEIEKNSNILNAHTHDTIANTYISMLGGNIDKSIYLTEKAHALIYYSEAKVYDKSSKMVSDMRSYIHLGAADNMSKEGFVLLYDTLNKIEWAIDIKDIHLLISEIHHKAQIVEVDQQDF